MGKETKGNNTERPKGEVGVQRLLNDAQQIISSKVLVLPNGDGCLHLCKDSHLKIEGRDCTVLAACLIVYRIAFTYNPDKLLHLRLQISFER